MKRRGQDNEPLRKRLNRRRVPIRLPLAYHWRDRVECVAVTKTVEQIRAMIDAQDAQKAARKQKAQDNYRYRRIREMPDMIEAARKKLDMLQIEALSYGLDPCTGKRKDKAA